MCNNSKERIEFCFAYEKRHLRLDPLWLALWSYKFDATQRDMIFLEFYDSRV